MSGGLVVLEQTGPAPDDARPNFDILAAVWRGLLSPWLLIAVSATILVLLVAWLTLPQLPGQLNDEPAAASRWLVATRTTFGAFGSLLQALSLFNVFHSFVFRALLSLLTILIALHLVDSIGRALTMLALPARLQALDVAAGEPIPLEPRQTVYRARLAIEADPEAVTTRLRDALGYMFETADLTGESQPLSDGATSLLGLKRKAAYVLQTLPPLGILLVLAALWLFLLVGWDIASPALAPGENYRAPAQELFVQYPIAPDASPSADRVALTVEVGGELITAAAAPGERVHERSVDLRVRSEEPALLVRSVEALPVLAMPGQSVLEPFVGLVLASPGSEEYILVPNLSMGLRIVRPADSTNGFLVEVYRGLEVEPERRITITTAEQQTLGTDGESIRLEFIPLPGLAASVRQLPGGWLMWPAAVLVIAGALGYALPPAFAVAQIAPWPSGALGPRSVVIVQTSMRQGLDTLLAVARNDIPNNNALPSSAPKSLRTLE